MVSRRFRQFVFWLHSWLGLHIFLILGVIFLSGTLLVFVEELDAGLDADRRIDPPVSQRSASFGQLYDGARAAHPQADILSLSRGHVSWIADKALIRTGPGRRATVWLHPGTGVATGTSGQTDIRRIIFEFHSSFLTEHRLGNLLMTAFSLPLLLFIVTGLITYRRFWKGFFRLPSRQTGARGWWGGMHRLVMLWALPFLIVMGLTSGYYLIGALGQGPKDPVHDIAPVTARDALLPAGFDGQALDRAVAVAMETLPGLIPETISLPKRPKEAIAVIGPGSAVLTGPEGQGVYVDPVSLAALGRFRSADYGLGHRLNQINDEMHFGLWGGFGSRLLWFVLGLASTFAMAAGAMIYAAKVAAPDPAAAMPGAARRIWQGMSALKWVLPLFVLAVLVVALLRFGPL